MFVLLPQKYMQIIKQCLRRNNIYLDTSPKTVPKCGESFYYTKSAATPKGSSTIFTNLRFLQTSRWQCYMHNRWDSTHATLNEDIWSVVLQDIPPIESKWKLANEGAI